MPNELVNESSPYLLQHANNPVNWKAWNDKAWNLAKAEDKLVLVSIGYSACHWCHVMEHESFEDTDVAKIMNDFFVCIKVDREERPDVDQVYMDAVQIITGRGGWPLNAICLPDGRPIYAGTYFPRDHWKQVLLYFQDYYQNKREEALTQATEITRGIKVMDKLDFVTDTSFQTTDRDFIFKKFDAVWDYEKGGRAGAPKFPMPANLHYLLRNYFYTKNEKALQALTVTLDNMLRGGIYDQVGGGFARYSVDGEWEIPHFEKMLYDNAQLVSVYSEAYQLTKNEAYKTVVYETLAFVARELMDKSGGFYSALDADSEGVEGKFYVWSYDELKEILKEDFDAFVAHYYVSKEGNFEGENNLIVREQKLENREQVNSNSELPTPNSQLKKWKQTLLAERAKRIRPGLDDKILTSWNALMLKGYVDAYKAFGDKQFLEVALQNAQFIKESCLQNDFRLTRNHKNGTSTINGFLDDYSFVCEAFIALYQVTFNEEWLRLSKGIVHQVIAKFYDADRGVFFYTSSDDSALIARKTETSDNVIPASNSSMAKVLFQLGTYLEENNFLSISRQLMMNMKETTLGYPTFYANWAQLLDWFIDPPYEVAIVGENAAIVRKELQQHYLPNVLILGAEQNSELTLLQDKFKADETWIYVCQNKTCGLPVKTVGEALRQMGGIK